MPQKMRVILLIVAVTFVVVSIIIPLAAKRTPAAVARHASERVLARADECAQLAREALLNKDAAGVPFDRRAIGVYLFTGDSVVSWNNARIPIRPKTSVPSRPRGLLKLTDGYYLYARASDDRMSALAVTMLKPAYPLQNNYLKNDFRRWTRIPQGIGLKTTPSGDAVVALDGSPLFALEAPERHYPSGELEPACMWMFFCGCGLALLLALRYAGRSPVTIFYFAVLVVLMRIVMIAFKWPDYFYRTSLYDLTLYGNADSWLNGYLGDIVLNAVSVLFLAQLLHKFVLFAAPSRLPRIAALAICGLLLSGALYLFDFTIDSLVSNSTLSFDFMTAYRISLPACVGIAAMGLYGFAIYIILADLVSYEPWKKYSLALAVCIAASWAVYKLTTAHSQITEAFWPLLLSTVIYFSTRLKSGGRTASIGLAVIVISAVSTRMLSTRIDANREKDAEVLALRLADRQDPMLESEFAPIPRKLASDGNVANLLNILPATAEALEDVFSQKYFSGYFRRYNVSYALFDERCLPLLNVNDPLLLSEGYLQDRIRYRCDSTRSPFLWMTRAGSGSALYIGLIPLNKKRLYVVMEPKRMAEPGSFPDLLLDQSQQTHEKLSAVSYAIYRSGKLTAAFGSYSYPTIEPRKGIPAGDDEYVHRVFSPDEFTTVITSTKKEGAGYFFTFNSYILLLFSLVIFGVYFTYTGSFSPVMRGTSLSRRIQAVIILILVLSMTAVGIISGRLVRAQFEQESTRELEERAEIILNEVTSAFKGKALFDRANGDAVFQKLSEFARLFNTDISLFDGSGVLCNTSQPRLYSLGLASPLVNPRALHLLKIHATSATTVREMAGTLDYLSLYAPVMGPADMPIGYLNLPYFARQKDLVSELSGIVSALVNVYVILFVLSIAAGLLLSGYITRPLRLVQSQIARVSLNRQNEKIRWESNDEIGKLVSAYNEMLVKLEESALLLAKSERESAWREMAKQVAHEIKNPLTPMKLSLQHLQQLAKSDPDAFRERFAKASGGLVEQIDSLANIANEFSHFAKLPGTRLQRVNIAEIAEASAATFAAHGGAPIVNRISEKELYVNGDPEQCLRVFNNILANALQAMEGVKDPRIVIDRKISGSTVVISIADNGCGIDEASKSRIFTPSFTTKSTGSGLGLAMVKSIMEELGGRIWFESEAGRGTVFFLQFTSS